MAQVVRLAALAGPGRLHFVRSQARRTVGDMNILYIVAQALAAGTRLGWPREVSVFISRARALLRVRARCALVPVGTSAHLPPELFRPHFSETESTIVICLLPQC